jgi:hypothetical protein
VAVFVKSGWEYRTRPDHIPAVDSWRPGQDIWAHPHLPRGSTCDTLIYPPPAAAGSPGACAIAILRRLVGAHLCDGGIWLWFDLIGFDEWIEFVVDFWPFDRFDLV